MIMDVHSHAWRYPDHFSDDFREQARRARAGVEVDLTTQYPAYRATSPAETRSIVFGGKAARSGLWVDDAYVADYVSRHADTLIGFSGFAAGGQRQAPPRHREAHQARHQGHRR